MRLPNQPASGWLRSTSGLLREVARESRDLIARTASLIVPCGGGLDPLHTRKGEEFR